ncbi:beta-galactosidase [Clostridium lacusfryxellense]|uniref:beta-galactosidase n=1 Tax=Clostridium lacusfryxellense TaxID=205328 RepID=UPI001C0D4132|nr:beta-galactosidase [Clostridium lacusfryxellense]MBU3113579.1 beta-galactosidase [Clostridium lacusfryxellense]
MNTNRNMKVNKLSLGTCYYPEHWDDNLWESDLKRMIEHGIKTIRIAEFAWSKFEPTEGDFTFDFFDRFMDVAKETGINVIFCTPTATPPSWLTFKYPEVLNANMEGVLYRHGARRHYNYNSPKYNELTKIIVTKLALHYCPHPNIVGWQIDNEVNCEKNEFYSESDSIAFRIFLKHKYGTLDNLNKAWGTVFWNQDYTDWEEVFVPRPTISNDVNPHQVMDYTRFISDSACKYVKLQSEILHKYIKKGDYITTNGLFGNLDNHRMVDESLDFIMYDSYPNFAYMLGIEPIHSTDLKDREWSRKLTEVRSISSNFGIMEQQSGANGWNTSMEAPSPKPGQMTLWTMQSVGHGADYVSYFRWRTSTMGTEIYWHGILDYSSRDNRRLAEIKDIDGKFEKIADIAGSKYMASFGVLRDYNNIWDAQLDKWHQRVEEVSQKGLFQASQLTHTPMDYVYILDNTEITDLMKYPVLFYPHATILTNEVKEVLEGYVLQGGCLIFGCRTGYKDATGKCVMAKLPGLVQELSGTDIPEYTFVSPADDKVYVDWDGDKLEAAVFNDILETLTDKQEILGNYTSNYYEEKAGLIKNSYGKGSVYYFGGAFTKETVEVFLRKLEIINPYADKIQLPAECEITVRSKEGIQYIFVLNYSKHEVEIELRQEMLDKYENKKVCGKVELKAYETKVYEI